MLFSKYKAALLFIFLPIGLFAQNIYQEMSDVIPNEEELKKTIEINTKIILENAPEKYIEEFKEAFKAREELVTALLENKKVLYDKELYNYIDNIFSHIIENNPVLKDKNIAFAVTSYPWPNASSLGNGLFLINIGLLRKLENESQLVFILSHELAHLYLRHAEKGLVEHLEKINSEAFKSKLDEIKKSEYGKNRSVQSLMREFVYDTRKHSRDYELSADSLGHVFLSNTNYHEDGSASGMKVLQYIDHYKFTTPIDYFSLFNSEEFQFKKRWLEVETSMFGGKVSQEEFFNRDSVRTHPDCSARAEKLKQMISDSSKSKRKFIQDSILFEEIKARADVEFIRGWLKQDDYALALFHTLKHVQEDSANYYLIVQAGTILRLIHEQQKKHNLSSYVRKPSVDLEEEYNQLLEFIDNISLSELSHLGYNFHKNFEFLKVNEDFLYNLIYFSRFLEKDHSFLNYKQLYLSNFPNGRYLNQL